MNQLFSFLKLDALKGIRTKLIVGVYVVLLGLVNAGYVDQKTFDAIMAFLIPIGVYFGIEHFEKKP